LSGRPRAGAVLTEDRPERELPRVWWRRRWVEDSALVVVAVLAAILVRAFVAQAYYIPSGSMVPQLHVNDRVVISRIAYHLHPVHRGDIVVFKAPPGVEPASARPPSDPFLRFFRDVGVALGLTQDQTVLIKRVVGLAGDTVQGKGGRVYVNGELLVEPYLPPETFTSTFGPITIPKGYVWVMGDNRGDSEDSRFFGAVPVKTIVGRAIWRVWPPWRPAFL
jgi:signal peptidase I